MKKNKWNWKKCFNGVIVVPEDTTDLIKYGTALVVALLVKYGYGEIGETEILLISAFVGFVVKAMADRLHHWLKYE